MNLDEYALMYRVEDTLWWYQGMEEITRALVERYYSPDSGIEILDAGCGTGAGMKYLARYGTVTGLDYVPLALQFSKQRGENRLGCGTVIALPFSAAAFDLLTSLDVLAMLNRGDDLLALREVRRVLKPGGRLLLRVPAHNWLRGVHDRSWDVCYRYALDEIASKVEQAGLRVEHSSYANMWLFPVSVAKRVLEPILPRQNGSDLTLNVGGFNSLLRAILSSEARWISRRRLPIGLSAMVIARKSAY